MQQISPKTLRGAFLFVLLLVVVFLLPNIIRLWWRKPEFKLNQSNEYAQERKKLEQEGITTYRPYNKKYNYKRPPSKFNPNSYGLEDWMNLGLSEKQSLVVLKFTRYGLRSNDDLKKIFVINDELFQLIKDSTVYDQNNNSTESRPDVSKSEKRIENFIVVDLNKASMEELDKVPGIGAYYAKSIVTTREKLGGFYEMKQLLEVYKLTEDQLAKWSPHLMLDKSNLRKINVNTASVEQLKAHPYISWNVANSLVKLREQHGPYKQVEDIKRSALIDAELYNKLKNYLKVNE